MVEVFSPGSPVFSSVFGLDSIQLGPCAKPGAWFKCRVGQWEGPGGITTGPNRVQVDSACKECFVFYLNLFYFSDSFVDLDNLP